MTIVFDKENARSFFKLVELHKDLGDELLRLLKRELNLVFNFSIDEADDALENQLMEINNAGGRKEKNLKIVYRKERFYSNQFCVEDVFDNTSVYLLEKISNKIKNSNKVLVGTIGEELDILSKLFIDMDEYSVHEEPYIRDSLQSWDDISPYVKPFSTIIIVDRYLFKSNNLALFDSNLRIILANFYKNQKEKTKLVFVYQTNAHLAQSHKDHEENLDFSFVKNKISKAIKSSNKHCPKPDVYFIGVPKNRIDDDHDRNLFTNYFRIKSNDVFVYFDSNGTKITNSETFDLYSFARSRYHETANKLLSKIVDIAKEVMTDSKYKRLCCLNGVENPKELIAL